MDQSHRGHDAIVGDLHSKLAAEGEECHEVDCTEHGGPDVEYTRGPVSRARVSLFLPLPFNDFELDKFRWTILLARLFVTRRRPRCVLCLCDGIFGLTSRNHSRLS